MRRAPSPPYARLALVVAVSLGLHALAWWFAHRLKPPPAAVPKEAISVEVREVTRPAPTKAAPVAKPVDEPSRGVAMKRPEPKIEKPKPAPKLAKATPKVVPPGPAKKVVDTAPTTPPGPPAAPRPTGPVNLFDPSALGLAMQRAHPDLPDGDRLQANGDDPNSAAAEQARVTSRLGQQVQAALAGAAVSSGFLSSCDDGLDNNIDGEIDCADPGCRELSLCDFTGVFEDRHAEPIPDGEGALVRSFDVAQEGRVRKLSLKILVSHASPGDLAVTLVGPDGRRAELKRPDRSDGTWRAGYYVRVFDGLRAAGRWTLRVEDRIRGGAGVLRAWSLYVTS